MILESAGCIDFATAAACTPLGLHHTRKSFYFWIFQIFNRYLRLVHH